MRRILWQTYRVSLLLPADLPAPAEHRLNDALDRARIVRRLRRFVQRVLASDPDLAGVVVRIDR